MAYNGYTNYETWNVSLWLANDEPMYRATQAFLNLTPYTSSANDIESFVREIMPEGTPDFDSVDDYEQVNWQEIASILNDDF